MSIIVEAPGILQVFSDGSVKRFTPEIAPASCEPSSAKGYKSKDVIIDPSKPITARIFLPDLAPTCAGGNIAHQAAVMIAQRKRTCPVEPKGLLLIHPYFGSEKRTKREMAEGAEGAVAMNDYVLGIELAGGVRPGLLRMQFRGGGGGGLNRVAAISCCGGLCGGIGFLEGKGVMYAEFLKKNGVKKRGIG
ncbi:hypothetical protein Acr_20g0001700 [Actinidia rufa]|uniref:Uncharacterized protein n=1 Tax=Actinidia rufa TaxID=165716 RepID=A0A7J0GC86_9ERIC|nr:hypothetical protein Acr_20g0001700 [Actinidia rufa]